SRSEESSSTCLPRTLLYERNMRGRWLVNRANDCAGNRELDHATRDPAPKELRRQGLDRERDHMGTCIRQPHKTAQFRAGAYAAGGNEADTKHGEEECHNDVTQDQRGEIGFSFEKGRHFLMRGAH